MMSSLGDIYRPSQEFRSHQNFLCGKKKSKSLHNIREQNLIKLLMDFG